MQMKLHILSTTRAYFGVIAARYILNEQCILIIKRVSDLFQWLGGPKKCHLWSSFVYESSYYRGVREQIV